MITRLISLITIMGVIFWLLPLGVFIKPSQEKAACNGQRAFHMCTSMMGMKNADSPSKLTLLKDTSNNPSPKSSASGNIHLWLFNALKISFGQKSIRFDFENCLKPQICASAIDHPPMIHLSA